MNEKKIKSLILNIVIILSIVLLLFFNYYYYFLSSEMLEVKKVESIVSNFNVKNKKDSDFDKRYFSDEAYYSSVDDEYLYLFDEEGNIIFEELLSNLDIDKVSEIAKEMFDDFDISYALYEDELVYVIVSEFEDVYISFNDFEKVFSFRKGV